MWGDRGGDTAVKQRCDTRPPAPGRCQRWGCASQRTQRKQGRRSGPAWGQAGRRRWRPARAGGAECRESRWGGPGHKADLKGSYPSGLRFSSGLRRACLDLEDVNLSPGNKSLYGTGTLRALLDASCTPSWHAYLTHGGAFPACRAKGASSRIHKTSIDRASLTDPKLSSAKNRHIATSKSLQATSRNGTEVSAEKKGGYHHTTEPKQTQTAL
nr:hypothetical protein CFP56_21300 [Quercus suber]